MVSNFWFLILLLVHLSLSPSSASLLRVGFHGHCDDSSGKYSINSTYEANLKSLFTKITTTNISYGFYNFSAGESPDAVYWISLCRGDVALSDCDTCQSHVMDQLTRLCTNQKKAIAWSDDCMVRFSDDSIYGVLEKSPAFNKTTGNQDVYVDDFSQKVADLLQRLANYASLGDSRLKFEKRQARVRASSNVTAILQCTPDLNQQDCLNCLTEAISEVESCCGGQTGATTLLPSCIVRYEADYEKSSDGNGSSKRPTGNGSSKRPTKIIVAAVVGSLSVTLIAAVCLKMIIQRKPWKTRNRNLRDMGGINYVNSLQFAFGIIRAATRNFSEANKLGRGGFGTVYKGTLSDGREIAVKRLARNSSQGEQEFKNEVLLVAKLQHRNLVRLMGFSLHDEERLLVYEFVPNASLDKFLFDAAKRAQLNWKTRYKIVQGIARGILYLHDDSRLRIIHRDLKPSNILLDAEMCPKISDFGMARLFNTEETEAGTKRIVGTRGYIAPEYAIRGYFSTKSDVYSFGVLLLEIITGRSCLSNNNHEDNFESLISWVWRKWTEDATMEVVDPTIIGDSVIDEILKCVQIGLLCVQDNMAERPAMSSVVLMMSTESSVPLPSRPAYVVARNYVLRSEDGSSIITRSAASSSVTRSTDDKTRSVSEPPHPR